MLPLSLLLTQMFFGWEGILVVSGAHLALMPLAPPMPFPPPMNPASTSTHAYAFPVHAYAGTILFPGYTMERGGGQF